MPRRTATVTQADVARIIRAAKLAGATEVEVKVNDKTSAVIRLAPSTDAKTTAEDAGEVVL